jgi:hypothetical protein
MAIESRLYLSDSAWRPEAKLDDMPLRCHVACAPGGYYPLIANGEIYVRHGSEALCLNCALNRGILTRERPKLAESVHLRPGITPPTDGAETFKPM